MQKGQDMCWHHHGEVRGTIDLKWCGFAGETTVVIFIVLKICLLLFSWAFAGQPPKIPSELTSALATHYTMLHVIAEQDEALVQKMQTLVKAMTDGTQWKDHFSADYSWGQAQNDHPENFILKQATSH